MLAAIIAVFLALFANLWLWGQWSFEKPTWWTVTLVFNSALILFVFGYSFFRIIKQRAFSKALHYWPLYICVYTVVVLSLLLFRHDFQFIITALIILKILSAVLMFFYKHNKKKKMKIQKKSVSPNS